MKKKTKFLKYSLIVLCYFFLFSNSVSANGLVPIGGKAKGDYQLDDLVQILILFANFFLKIAGSLALLAFVFGGVMLIISGGNKERVQKGQQVLVAAVVGLLIVFTSWLIISFSYKALTGKPWDGGINFPNATTAPTAPAPAPAAPAPIAPQLAPPPLDEFNSGLSS